MENFNYRASAIQKISETKRTLDNLCEKHPDNQTLKTFATQIVKRMEFMEEMLDSWYRDGITEKWDAETISNGKAACMGNIDALELLIVDIKADFKKG